ncbi:hypothetical protein [Saccharothrix hoggarensis]|uniref:Bacteriophage HK97-gp10 tail-component n=1 Tax=Saccharothrix hoggarensis TaxID=913853 RepID=A0ABW3QN48_9PSEU
MSVELTPARMRRLFDHLGATAVKRSEQTLVALADLVVNQARINASSGRHPYGTPTPARPGSGPAIISQTLVNSIVRTKVRVTGAAGQEILVGIAPNRYPVYNGRVHKVASSRYGLALETTVGGRRGLYPFLGPAARFVVTIPAVHVYRRILGAGDWLRL